MDDRGLHEGEWSLASPGRASPRKGQYPEFRRRQHGCWVVNPSRKPYQLGGRREPGGEGGSVGCGGDRGPASQDVADQGGFWPLSREQWKTSVFKFQARVRQRLQSSPAAVCSPDGWEIRTYRKKTGGEAVL